MTLLRNAGLVVQGMAHTLWGCMLAMLLVWGILAAVLMAVSRDLFAGVNLILGL